MEVTPVIDVSTIDLSPISVTVLAVVGIGMTFVITMLALRKGLGWFKKLIKGA